MESGCGVGTVESGSSVASDAAEDFDRGEISGQMDCHCGCQGTICRPFQVLT